MIPTNWKAGDWVEILGAPEIARTLDPAGTLDGLPFMPEMAPFCGRRCQVLRLAEKACIEYPGGGYKLRRFRHDDVLILDLPRCDGRHHEGCGRACVFFWKTAWLRPAASPAVPAPAAPAPAAPDSVALQSPDAAWVESLRTTVAPGHYFCQSTEMARATEPLSRPGIFRQCVAVVRSGSRSPAEMAGLILAPLWRKATRRFPRRKLAGTLRRTPTAELNLQPGEWVRIRSAEQIAQTLDANGKNRGLLCDHGMCQYSGGRYRVRNRLDRMIAEPTGQMRQVQNTVILEGLQCLCWNVVGGCPRADYMYWREIWLERAEPDLVQISPAPASESEPVPLSR